MKAKEILKKASGVIVTVILSPIDNSNNGGNG